MPTRRRPRLSLLAAPMLTFSSLKSGGKTCDGVSRRGFLSLGGLCAGGLTLADLLRGSGASA